MTDGEAETEETREETTEKAEKGEPRSELFKLFLRLVSREMGEIEERELLDAPQSLVSELAGDLGGLPPVESRLHRETVTVSKERAYSLSEEEKDEVRVRFGGTSDFPSAAK